MAVAPRRRLPCHRAQERILDLGCGSGELTARVAELVQVPRGSITGVDLSADLLGKAIASTQSQQGFTFQQLDGHDLDQLDGERDFDAVFSNAALHWMSRDPSQVAKGAYQVLREGGRFVAEMGGAHNVAGVRAELYNALHTRGIDASKVDPFYWPTARQQTKVLEEAGFSVQSCGEDSGSVRVDVSAEPCEPTELVPRITPLPTGLAGWLETFAFAFLEALPQEERSKVVGEVCDRLAVDMKTDEGWTVMYTRLRFVAVKD